MNDNAIAEPGMSMSDDVAPGSVSSACARLDRVVNGVACGWAFDSERAGSSVRVQIRVGERVLGEGDAGHYEEVLERAGIGDGRHAFRVMLELPFTIGSEVVLTLHNAVDGRPLLADAFMLACHDPALLAESELDGRSVRALPPAPRRDTGPAARLRKASKRAARKLARQTRSRLRRSFAGRLSRLPGRVIQLKSMPVAVAELAPGAAARLARLDLLSVGALANIERWPALELPDPSDVDVSIIVPVHNQFHLTYQCLVSLILSADKTRFEVLLVDDLSSDATCAIEQRVKNLRVIRNEKNLGFLGSCMRASAEARGNFVLFLNNDTEVMPGWLDEMRDVFARFDSVGAVGAKLVYPDGRLQDAGGIVWESGKPWNVGHGRDPDDPEFGYVREVDYLTGAALMVKREAWDLVGGFTADYAPAYYEDTDIAFKLREAGYRTLFCPQATVIHYEGRSNGTSLEAGVKRHQVINAERFKETWKNRFEGLGKEGVDLRRNKDRNRGLRVLMIDHEYPRAGRDAGSYAALQEMRLLIELGCKLTFMPGNLAWAGTHVEILQRMGVECVHRPWHRSLDSLLESRGHEFDVIYVTRYTVAEKAIGAIRRHSNARIILNNADLHFLRELRGALTRGDKDLSGPQRTRERELAVMSKVDAVLSYNDIEQAIIASHLMRDDHVFTCPWVLDAATSTVSFEARRGIAFLGGFAHPPNSEAMDWFVTNVMPLLRTAMPDLDLHIWGSGIPDDVGWSTCDGVIVHGYAESLDEVFDNCRVFVAPLRSGAGIKGKVLDSVARGVPTVLSPVAAEGTGLIDGLSTLIATTPEQWVSSIRRLTEEEPFWQSVSTASLALRDERYSRAHGIARLREVFDALGLDTRTHSRPMFFR